jgi:hypothetical protein
MVAAAGGRRAIAEGRDAQADLSPRAFRAADVVVRILPTLNVQVSADGGVDGVAVGLGAAQVGIASGVERERVSRGDSGVDLRDRIAVGVRAVSARGELEGDTVSAYCTPNGSTRLVAYLFLC